MRGLDKCGLLVLYKPVSFYIDNTTNLRDQILISDTSRTTHAGPCL